MARTAAGQLFASVPLPFSVRRRSFGPVARRTHSFASPDLAARRSSAATSPRPQHSRFLKHFFASPSTDFLAGRGLAVPPVNFFLRDSAASAVPEATIEALKAQVAKLQGEKEQLLKEHNEALEAQKTALGELKEQAIQAALRHDQALKDARVAVEARLAEVVEDSTNANTVLTAELEEERKSRKAAERLIDTMTTDHREYDRLVMKIDALALRKFLPCPFFCL
ncbi:uncharacterized protein [Lolium perenne]|uniref:uncharacterized protein n=1 Tax=Lolium perenne TaxID=4522 RepID=UPI003A99EEA8